MTAESRGAGGQAERAARQHGAQRRSALAGDAVKRNSTTSEPSRSTATPTTTESADKVRSPVATAAPMRPTSAANFAAVTGHPHIVPGQHADGQQQDGGIDSSAPEPSNSAAISPANAATRPRAQQPRAHARRDPARAARHALGRRQHDADHKARLDDFAENDQKTCQHDATPRSPRLARFRMEFAHERVRPAPAGATALVPVECPPRLFRF